MENLTNSLSSSQLINITPEQLTAAQQMYIDFIDKQQSAKIPTERKFDQSVELQARVEEFADLLRKNKEQAQLTIGQLISSANSMTATLVTALTSAPLHPYEKLLYDYLGPNFICPSITDLTIPENFCPKQCLVELENVAQQVGALQTNHFARLSAEAMDTSFYGITSENLNNAFAVLSSTAKGEQYVIDADKLKQHLIFVETVKSIPVDYVLKNPLEVAKKMLAEFTKIHNPILEADKKQDKLTNK